MTQQTAVDGQEIWRHAQTLSPQLRAWRHEIHRHPEVSFTEHRTAGLVTAVLSNLGIPVETEVAKTGVVGHIQGGVGPVVGLRADMDALPIQEESGVEFASTRPGIMHACGHDAHTAILMGAATILKGLADQGRLPGSVRLLFQPSEEAQDEEGKSGGMRMVEEGALSGLNAVFGLHIDTNRDVGQVATRPGPMMAAADKFEVVIRGRGGHAARPHTTVDPIVLASHVVQAIHQIVSRRMDPIEAGVVTIGTIHGGTANNIIPESVTLSGTMRSFTPEVRQLLRDELRRACSLVESLGGRFDLTVYPGYPPTVNSEEATQTMMEAAGEILGQENVLLSQPVMPAEDFSYMAQIVPGNFLRLGTHNPAWERRYQVHTPQLLIDEDALPIGAAALAAAALKWMQNHGG